MNPHLSSAEDGWQHTKKPTLDEGTTLAPPHMHLVYKEGYWVNADDIIFIMSALLGDIHGLQPGSWSIEKGGVQGTSTEQNDAIV